MMRCYRYVDALLTSWCFHEQRGRPAKPKQRKVAERSITLAFGVTVSAKDGTCASTHKVPKRVKVDDVSGKTFGELVQSLVSENPQHVKMFNEARARANDGETVLYAGHTQKGLDPVALDDPCRDWLQYGRPTIAFNRVKRTPAQTRNYRGGHNVPIKIRTYVHYLCSNHPQIKHLNVTESQRRQ